MTMEEAKNNASEVVARVRTELKSMDTNQGIEYLNDIMDELERFHQKLWDSTDGLEEDEVPMGAWEDHFG